MIPNWLRISAIFLCITLGAAAFAGCEKESDTSGPAPEPWRYESEQAPYAITVPGQWSQIPTKDINRFADVALTLSERFYAIIIPQELPRFEGVESPDALAIKRASLKLLENRIDNFEIENQGPLKLDGQLALSVIAQGTDKGKRVQYINTYVTRGERGYQIVAWGPAKQKEGLVAATDALLSGWEFTDSAPSPGEPEPPRQVDPADAAAPN